MRQDDVVSVRVWGEYACFTRPELKGERVSYRVMTPSAARGVLESIFWKPEFSWRVRRIAVLNPIRGFSLMRNEVGGKIAPDAVTRWSETGQRQPYYIDDDRQQRSTLGLRDVAYQIDAGIHLRGGGSAAEAAKYREQFLRRVEKGQCYTRPCLGCREFAAHFGPSHPPEAPTAQSEDLGLMLFDMHYDSKAGRYDPVFFEAVLEGGVLAMPPSLYEEVGL